MVERSLSYLLVRVAKAHRVAMAAALQQVGLHVGQEFLLLELEREDGARQRDLAERLGIEEPTVSRALQRMERSGLVERRRDPQDTRISRVYATPAGRSLWKPIRQAWSAADRDLTAGLSPADRATLARLLEHLRTNLEGPAAASGGSPAG